MTNPGKRDVDPIETEYLFDLVANVDAGLDMGAGPVGRRVLNRTAGGSFAGPRLRGDVLAGSGDWALFRSDGVMVIDARVTLRTDDGALIYMTYGGRAAFPDDVRPFIVDVEHRHEIDPARYYFRTTPLFETGAPAYHWLNSIVAVGYGYLTEGGGVGYQVSAVV